MQDLQTRFAGADLEADLRRHCAATPPHSPLSPERAMAQRYGISHSTVRRVLASLCEAGLIYKVQGKGNFVADQLEASSTTVKTLVYADTWTDPQHVYYSERLRGMLDLVQDRGYRLEIVKAGHRLNQLQDFLPTLTRPDTVGLILPWVGSNTWRRLQLQCPRLRVVVTANRFGQAGVSAVMPDYAILGLLGTRYLLSRGCRRPCLIARNTDTRAGVAVVAGENGHDWRELRIPEMPDLPPLAPVDPAALLAALRSPGGVTGDLADGLLFDDDVVANHCLSAWAELAPEWLAGLPVASHANVGTDNLPPRAARLELDGFAVGRLLASTLLTMIETPALPATTVLVRPELRLPPGERIADFDWQEASPAGPTTPTAPITPSTPNGTLRGLR